MGNVTRREFLEDSLAVTGAAAAACVVPSTGGPRGSAQAEFSLPDLEPRDEPVRVGVIGVRGRGRAHVGAFKKSKDSEVVAICDADEAVIGGRVVVLSNRVPGANNCQRQQQQANQRPVPLLPVLRGNQAHLRSP